MTLQSEQGKHEVTCRTSPRQRRPEASPSSRFDISRRIMGASHVPCGPPAVEPVTTHGTSTLLLVVGRVLPKGICGGQLIYIKKTSQILRIRNGPFFFSRTYLISSALLII